MNKKFFSLLLVLIVNILILSGCTLARAEKANPAADRLVGVYLVKGRRLQQDENWIEYGSQQLDSNFGKLTLPNMILPATYDSDADTFRFPGTEGYALVVMTIPGEAGPHTTSICDLHDSSFGVTVTDFGTDYDLSGTLYVSEGDETSVWSVYRVFQTADGMIYLDGTGNSYQGSGFSTTINETTTVNDGEREGSQSTIIHVSIKPISKIEKIIVRQYNADGQLLDTSELAVSTSIPPLFWNADAAWAAIEEYHPDEIKRSVVNRPLSDEETAQHTVYVLNENEIGQAVSIILQEPTV